MDNSRDWLRRAKSAYRLAGAGLGEADISFEDRCFQLQQAAEKSLKALLIHSGCEPPHSHDVVLLAQLAGDRCPAFEVIADIADLNDYAVQTRYPGDYTPVDENEFLSAKAITERVLDSVEQLIEAPKQGASRD